MELKYFIILMYFVSISCNKILILSDANSESIIESNNNTLVQITSLENCNSCDKMYDSFKESFRTNKDLRSLVAFAKLDIVKNQKFSEKYKVNIVPSIQLFQKGGKVFQYSGVSNSTEITNWVRKKIYSPIIGVKDPKTVGELVKKFEYSMIYFGGSASLFYGIYQKIADEYYNIEFIQCNSEECQKHYNIEAYNLIFFKNYGKIKIILKSKDQTEEEFKVQFKLKFQDELEKFDSKISTEIFSDGVPGFILYRDENKDTDKKLENIMSKLAKQLRGKIKVVISDVSSELEKNFADFLGLKKEDLPTVRIFEASETLKKYKYEGEISFEKLYEFYVDWKSGKVKPYLKSEAIPLKQNNNVFKLVGNNFYNTVFDAKKDVLVMFYNNNESEENDKMNDLEKLAKIVKNNKNLVIGAIDVSLNELELVDTSKTPHVMLFPAGKKENHHDYSGQITVRDLKVFLKKYSKNALIFDKNEL